MAYDTIIIGAGPAGLSAAVYCARKKMQTIILSGDIGGMTAQSGMVENYLGFDGISGPELVQKFQEHVMKYKDLVELKTGELVDNIKKENDEFIVKTNITEYSGKTVIVATGKVPRKLNIPGESKYANKGVAYCATCDGPLFSGKDVAVIGGGNSAMDAILSLMPIAKKIYGITINPEFIGDQVMLEKITSADNVELIKGANIKKIIGEQFVTGLEYEDKNQKIRTLSIQGIFVNIGSMPSTKFVKDLVKLNKYGEIIIDSMTKTNIPGLFAAGDSTTVPEKQIIVAAGEGCKAALAAFSYLNGNNGSDY